MRKILFSALIIVLSLSFCSIAYADDVYIEDGIEIAESQIDNNTDADINSSRYRTVHVLYKTVNNKYLYPDGQNKDTATIRAHLISEKQYKVYQENISTGVRHFLYWEYKTNWTGQWRKTTSSKWHDYPDFVNITETSRVRYGDIMKQLLDCFMK